MTPAPPVPLASHHRFGEFACGEPALDDWVRRHARAAQSSGAARVYVAADSEGTVSGFYALAACQIEAAAAPERLPRGEPRLRPVPAVLLARLAVDLRHQGPGVGQSLLRDALLRCLQASTSVGIRALLVHAKGDEARRWYERLGFAPSPTDPYHLVLLLKGVAAIIGAGMPSGRADL